MGYELLLACLFNLHICGFFSCGASDDYRNYSRFGRVMKKRVGIPLKYSKKAQVVSIALSPEAYHIFCHLKPGEKSEKISRLIEKHLKTK